MFGKKNSDELLNQSAISYVGESMQVEGHLECSGTVDVAGLINGDVNVKEMTVFDTGSIKGNINVKKITIKGHIEGQVIGDEISLGSSAVIKGDITFKTFLKTEEGAEIDGYIKGRSKGNIQDEEDEGIDEITARPGRGGKPTLVKDNKKEAI